MHVPNCDSPVSTDVTLAGLELGLLTMKKGEFSRFLFEPRYAYGDLGCPPLIPALAVVLYEVHILDFLDSGQVDDFTALSPVRRYWKRINYFRAGPFGITTSRNNIRFEIFCFCFVQI